MIIALASIYLQVAATTKPMASARPLDPVARVAVSAPPPAASDSVRTEEEFHAAGQRFAGSVRGCYEQEGLKRDPSLKANVDVSVTVAPNGLVRDVEVDTLAVRGIGMKHVVTCVETLAKHWHFSSGSYALEVMTFTYMLRPDQ